jgi:two-component system chemotaxis response regulator CheB
MNRRHASTISQQMAHVELIVIGASAGGLDGLLTIVKSLPHSLPASVIVVMHNNTTSNLASILARVSALPVGVPENGDAIAPGRVLVAPPDYHLLVTKGGVVLHRGPRENGFRPAIDPLFRTAAQVYGNRVMGVILSGALDDGTYGMKVIKDGGGVAVVQDPEEASIPSMPLSVIENVAVDHVARASDIPDLIVRLTARAGRKGTAMPRRKEPEPQDLATDTRVETMNEQFGPPSGITCPDCGGALWQVQDGTLTRYRCHVGHQFSPEGLESRQRDAVEWALWSAVRALEEQADFRQRMAERAEASGLAAVRDGFAASARESHGEAATIRAVLFERRGPDPPEPLAPSPRSRPSRSKLRRAGAKRARRSA